MHNFFVQCKKQDYVSNKFDFSQMSKVVLIYDFIFFKLLGLLLISGNKAEARASPEGWRVNFLSIKYISLDEFFFKSSVFDNLNFIFLFLLFYVNLTKTSFLILGVQGIGWWLEEANIAQISLNLTDMDLTPMHTAYEEVLE